MLSKARSLGCVLAMVVSATAMADPMLQGTTSDPTGITGLVVDGITYDVSFSTVPSASPFLAGTTASANAAAALASALNSFSVKGLLNSITKFTDFALMVDGTLTGDAAALFPLDSPSWFGDFFSTSFSPGGWGDHTTCIEPNPCEGPVVEAANFTAVPATVPEPGNLLLLGFGLAAVGAAGRKSSRARTGRQNSPFTA